MSPKLPKSKEKNLVTIGRAANFLGVSIDTVRRWEAAGKISSIRLDGKNRYFSLTELQKYKKTKPLKVSEAAKKLGISSSTLRRREKEGLISPIRGKKGERLYSKESVELLAKKKKSIVSKPPAIPKPPKKDFVKPRDFVSPKTFTPRKIPWGAMSFVIVILISIWVLVVNPAPRQRDYSQAESSQVLGFSVKDSLSGLFTKASSFFDRLAFRFSDQWIADINDIFELDEKGNLIPKVSFNLSEEDLEEMKGKEEPGDFVTFSENNTILALRVLSSNLVSGAVIGGEAGIILDSSITSHDIADGAITSLKIKNGAIVNADLSDGVINSAKIEDGSISASDLSSSLAFSDQDLIDLSDIDHSDISQQGLILPNVSSATPTSPVSGQGYLAYNTADDEVIVFDGSSWIQVGGTEITLSSSGTTSTTSSNSGLELVSTDLSLLRGCSNGQILKWNSTLEVWYCAADSGGGGGSATVEEGDAGGFTAAYLDFSATDFAISESPLEEANISIDYTNSKIVRSDQTESITGGWTLSNLTVSDTNVPFSGGNTTIDITGAATRTLTLLNSTMSQVANLNLSDGSLQTGGTTRLTNAGVLQNITGLTVSSGTLTAGTVDINGGNIDGTIIGASSQAAGSFSSLTVTTGALAVNSDSITSDGTTLTINASGTVAIDDNLDVSGTIQAGSEDVVLTNANGYVQAGSYAATSIDGDDLNSNLAGNGLTLTSASPDTLDIQLTSTGNTGLTSSNSGLEVGSGGLTLLKGCGTGEILKWNDSSSIWECATDSGGGGGGIVTIQENDSTVVSSAVTIDFLGADFAVTDAGSGEGDIAIDYSNSGITRKGESETVTGGWTFNTASTTFTTSILVNGGMSTGAGTALGIDSGTTGAINLGTGANAKTITIGNSTTSTSIVFDKGASGNFTLQSDGSALDCSGYSNGGTLTTNSSGNIICANDDSGGGGGSLDTAYDSGGTITVDAYDVLFNLNDATNDYKFTIDNTTNATIDTAVAITTTGGASSVFTTGIDLSDAGISTAIAIGTNNITTGATTIASTELDILDSGIALSELTDSGTLTAGTVDIGGGNIDGTTIGGSSAAAGTFTGLTVTTGALAVNSDSITSDGATLTINAGGTVDIQDALSISGGLSGVTTLGTSGDWTWTATTPTITLNTDETFTISDPGGAFNFSVSTGPSYTGDARPTRKITLSPEYPGAVLTGDGSSNTGTMTSDFCENGASADIPQTNTGVCNTSGDIHDYYSWTTSQGSAQDYDIWIRWRVPDNFSAWVSNPINVYAKRTDTSNNAVRVYVYDTAGTLENSGGTQVAGTSWTQTTVEASFAGTYTAGSYMTIRIVMTADTGGDSVQVGEISLDYLSSN